MSPDDESATPTRELPRLAVLFSGGGRTLENLAQCTVDGSLAARIVLAISSHPEAGGMARARGFGIPTEICDFRRIGDGLSDAIDARLEHAAVDWVLLAGYLRHFRTGERWRGRALNIHPSLLPACGGKGFYGERVHRAVLASRARTSGCTVHFVDDEYDHGPIILQRAVPVRPDDTVDSLAARVFAAECVAYPEALRLCLAGRVHVRDGGVSLSDAGPA